MERNTKLQLLSYYARCPHKWVADTSVGTRGPSSACERSGSRWTCFEECAATVFGIIRVAIIGVQVHVSHVGNGVERSAEDSHDEAFAFKKRLLLLRRFTK
jgi:hypothetical protein